MDFAAAKLKQLGVTLTNWVVHDNACYFTTPVPLPLILVTMMLRGKQ